MESTRRQTGEFDLADTGMTGIRLARAPTWSALRFDRPRPVLSSAPFHGGHAMADRIVNLCVDGPDVIAHCDDPAACFRALEADQGWAGTTVGMMTGVPAARLGVGEARVGDSGWLVLATVGTRNAHRAGEAPVPAHAPGTINVIAATSLALSAAARAEALMLVTEAKCAVLADRGIGSANGRGIATGTGTDAVAIAGADGDSCRYGGHHTDCGQALARAARQALAASLDAAD